MKYILIFFALIAQSLTAQITVTDLGLPQITDLFKNAVITSGTVNTIAFSRGTHFVRSQNNNATGYVLNYLHDRTHEDSFIYVGESAGTYIFSKAQINFTFNGKDHQIDGQTMSIYKWGGLWNIKLTPQTSSYTILENRVRKTYTADELAAKMGITKVELWSRDADYFYAVDRNPESHITSVFVAVDETGSGTFTAQTYVNLNPAMSYGNRITSYGKSGISYVVRWKFYNDCTRENAISGGFERGNFGLCEMRGPLQMGSEQFPVAFQIDTSKEYAVVECMIEESPAQGKNFSASGYFTVQGCDEDDPCGPTRRLPRKPVQ